MSTLTPDPVPDRFQHETPLRAFSDWNETGLYAIGKGLRPSVAHLPVYLDAIERKEGWQLVQMLLDDKGNFRSAIFRRDPRDLMARYRDEYPAFQHWLANKIADVSPEREAVFREANEKMNQVREMSDEMDREAGKGDTIESHGVTTEQQARSLSRPEGTVTPIERSFTIQGPNAKTTWDAIDEHFRSLGFKLVATGDGSLRYEPERKIGASAALGASYEVTDQVSGDPYEAMAEYINPPLNPAAAALKVDLAERARKDYQTEQMFKDDPVNPKDYGGTACAEIGERLTANCYQVLKYCWWLGEKDDLKTPLGKAVFYARRELALGLPRARKSIKLTGLKQDAVLKRTENQPWRRMIALMLWDMCYGFGSSRQWEYAAKELIHTLECKLAELEGEAPCTTGLAL